MRISVHYTTMIVSSMEESVKFYRDVLGFEEGYHVDLPVGQITIMKSPGGASVELIENPQFEKGLYSVGTDVDNLEEVVKHLEKNGCSTMGPAARTTVGVMTFVQDPDGNRICLIEHDKDYVEKYLG